MRGEFEPSMEGQADFSAAKFRMPARFAGMRCDGNGLFGETYFAQTADFSQASFAGMFFIHRAEFGGPVLVRGARFPHPPGWSDAKLASPPAT